MELKIKAGRIKKWEMLRAKKGEVLKCEKKIHCRKKANRMGKWERINFKSLYTRKRW